MNTSDPIEEFNKKLQQLIHLRKQEEEQYGKLLTLLDQYSNFSLPQETASRLDEVKNALNKTWDVSNGAFSIAEIEERNFWKDVARNTVKYIQPFVLRQREFNSLVVHLLNEFVSSVTNSLDEIRKFHNTLILYFQKIIPVIDSKYREMVCEEDKNVALNLERFQGHLNQYQDHLDKYQAHLQKYQDHLGKFEQHLLKLMQQVQETARDHADVLYQELDRKMETLQVDSKEFQETLASMQTSVRSLHHLANTFKSVSSKSQSGPVTDEYRYFHFEEDFRGTREEIKDRFTRYVKFFKRNEDTPVLDLGCGRGEFLELLKEASIPGIGVDSNQKMVQMCRDLGLEVSEGDLLKFLRSKKENSLNGIFCSQVIEHLPPDYLLGLLEAAHARLKPGAPILMETVNIGSAFAYLQVYTRDLTHRTPVHPDTLRFLVAAAGFQNPEILYTSPVPSVAQLKMFQDSSDEFKAVFNHNMTKLNKLLFDYQEYAVLATK